MATYGFSLFSKVQSVYRVSQLSCPTCFPQYLLSHSSNYLEIWCDGRPRVEQYVNQKWPLKEFSGKTYESANFGSLHSILLSSDDNLLRLWYNFKPFVFPDKCS